MSEPMGGIPSWLVQSQDYEPRPDRDAFITKSILSVSSLLACLRLDGGTPSSLSPSASAKLAFAFAGILLTSLSRNYLFVLVMLALVLVRAALLPQRALARVVAVSLTAALLTFALMLPALLIAQPRAPLTMATKALVTAGLALEVALTTPAFELTGALRTLRMPNLLILTIDLALRSIVRLGEVALEVLTALKLRSVGRNADKRRSMGGVGGVVLIKASEAAQTTYDAMRCRGFEGEYDVARARSFRPTDPVLAVMLALLVTLFTHLQSLV